MVLLRRIAKTESSGAITLLYFIMLLLIALPVTILQWKTPTASDFAIMVVTGLASGIGNVMLILAFRRAAATIVSSFMYSQLIWGAAFGLALFGDCPT